MTPVLELDDVVGGCVVVERLNRFTVRIRWRWGEALAHNTNTGRLREVLVPGARCYCRPLRRPGKTRCRLVAVETPGGLAAIIDTALQEEAFAASVEKGLLPWLTGCRVAARRPRLGGSTLDFLLDCPEGRVYVETKSAVLLLPGGLASYPDCPTERGRRHIRELIEAAEKGQLVALVFIAAVPGARGFTPNREADPEIHRLVTEAVKAGVRVKAVGMLYDPAAREVKLYSPSLPLVL